MENMEPEKTEELHWQDPYNLEEDDIIKEEGDATEENTEEAVEEDGAAADKAMWSSAKQDPSITKDDIDWMRGQLSEDESDDLPKMDDYKTKEEWVSAVREQVRESERKSVAADKAVELISETYTQARALYPQTPPLREMWKVAEKSPEVFGALIASDCAPIIVALLASNKKMSEDIFDVPVPKGLKALGKLEYLIEQKRFQEQQQTDARPVKPVTPRKKEVVDISTRIKSPSEALKRDDFPSNTSDDMVAWVKFRNQSI